MVYHHARERSNISSSGLRRSIDRKAVQGTKRKHKLGSGRSFRTTITNCNPLALLRTIVMVTTLWYHSMSSTRGRTTSRVLVNAWSITKIHTNSPRTSECHLYTRRRIIPSSSTSKTKLHQPSCTSFSHAFTSHPPGTKDSHRLFSSTTSVDEGSKDAQSTPSQADTDAANLHTQQDDAWKESPLINPTINFETLLVPNAQLTKWITHPGIQHRLAKPDNWEFLKHVHPRIKLVQDYNENKQYKQLLLLPSSLSQESASNHTATGIQLSTDEKDTDDWLSNFLSEESNKNEETPSIQKGPSRPMSISANQLSFQYILKRLLPESALPPPSAYEQIGHVAHFNLKKVHLPFKHLIGSALLESNTGDSIQTVVNKVGQVDGKFRTYECEILANNYKVENGNEKGVDDIPSLLETTVVEDGISIELNVAECYWCTRLSGERKELIKDIVKGRKKAKSDQVAPPLVVADVFCGAGAVCMLLAKKIKDQDKSWLPDSQQPTETKAKKDHPSLTILANDWNPKAIEYMKRSIATNGMDKEQEESLYHKFDLSCRDSYDFLSELGEEKQTTKVNPYIKKKLLKKKMDTTKEEPPLMPDHVLMNFPLEAPQFLGAIRWWSWKRLRDEAKRRSQWQPKKKGEWAPRFHVYTFARASSPRANDEEEMAVNLVANELLPERLFDHDDDDDDGIDCNDESSSDDKDSIVVYRREELDDEFGTGFSTRLVRDVAPGKVVVCVSFSVTPKLIRYMQGDYC